MVRPGGQRDLERVRQVIQEEGHGLLDPRVGDHVVVVEHEDEPGWEGRQFVEQQRKNHLVEAHIAHPEKPRGRGAKAGLDRLQGLDHAAPEADGVVVGRVEGKPGKGSVLVI